MKLFNFGKTQPNMKQAIEGLADYIPEFYKTHKQFTNYIEFLNNREWELAVDSLIELAYETGYSFSQDFWLGLINCFEKMGLIDKANYYRLNQTKQIL